MLGLLAALFLIIPFIEIAIILKVGHEIGFAPTIALLLAISVTGAWLMKQQGFSTWRKATTRLEAGGIPTKELVDGAIILFAGALLLTPGFFTDLFGILLLFPPTRAAVRHFFTSRFKQRHVETIIIDTTEHERRPQEQIIEISETKNPSRPA